MPGGVSDNTKILLDTLQELGHESQVFSEESIKEMLKTQNPELVIIQYSPFMYGRFFNFVPSLLKTLKKASIKSCVFIHELYYVEFPFSLRDFIYLPINRRRENLLMENADIIISSFNKRQEEIKTRWGRKSVIVRVCSNIPKSDIKQEKEKLLGCFGTYHKDMNIEPMLGFLRVREDYKGVMLGDMPEKLQALIKLKNSKLVDSGRLVISGKLKAEELAEKLRTLRYFLHFDARGLSSRKGSLAAAFYNGCNIIGNVHEWTDKTIFKDGENFTECTADVGKLEECIKELDTNPGLRKSISFAAEITGEKYFSPKSFTEGILRECIKD